MLLKILKKIRDMQFFSLSKLANELNIDEAMASHIIEQLKAMGYLKEEVTDMSCNSGCAKCSSCPGMSKILSTNTLVITEKGNRASEAAT